MIPIFQWMAWGNIFKYAGEILVANEFHGLQLTCHKNGTSNCIIPVPVSFSFISSTLWLR